MRSIWLFIMPIKTLTNVIFLIFGLFLPCAKAQNYLDGLYQINQMEYKQKNYTLFSFYKKSTQIKAKYFVRGSKSFASLRGKKILFYCSGAFSQTWDENSVPLGICVDRGKIINRNVDAEMDGLVVVYNGGSQAGEMVVVNLETEMIGTSDGNFLIRKNGSDKIKFLNWARKTEITLFQTQLMYSNGYDFPLDKLRNGKKAERRFLAICQSKKGVLWHVIVDAPQSDYLNTAAKNVSEMIQSLGYKMLFLLNLDTGGRNVMRANNDRNQVIKTVGELDKAINLLVYYTD